MPKVCRVICGFLTVMLLSGFSPSTTQAADTQLEIAESLKVIQRVSREGSGNEAAKIAWKKLTTAGGPALLPTLSAFDTADATSANWLRSAVDAIVEGVKKAKHPLPLAELETFAKEKTRTPAARRIAFELINAEKPDLAAKLLPTFLDDPSLELRRDAISAALKEIPENARKNSASALRKLFAAARDKDQVEELANLLKEAGEQQDVTRHFGFITEWHIIGPFDGSGENRLSKKHPPEGKVDLAEKYPGKGNPKLPWMHAQSGTPSGVVDLNAPLSQVKDATAYAYCVLESPKEMNAELRVSSPNGVQVFVNGKLVFERDEYHHGATFDQYTARFTLIQGQNQVLIKIVQNDQTQDYAKVWQFAARICDATGGKLPLNQIILREGKLTTISPGALKPTEKKESK